MGEINVQLTVINTHLFFWVSYSQFNIYLFFISVKWYTFICETAFTFHKSLTHSFVLLFLFYAVHEPFWFVILHRNIEHTKLLGGMCDKVKILSPNYHLFSPLTHLVLLWINHSCIISKLWLKFFIHFIRFSYVLADFPVSVNDVSAAFTQFIIAWFGGLYYLFCCDIFMTLSQLNKIIFLCGWSVTTSHTTHKGDPH